MRPRVVQRANSPPNKEKPLCLCASVVNPRRLVRPQPVPNTDRMAASTISARTLTPRERARSLPALVWGAPIVAVLAGLSAQWLDFRALRYPLLLLVLAGALATAYALFGVRATVRAFAMTALLGVVTWAAAETLYVVIHGASGQSFDAPRFGAQWSQALGLIAIHAGVLGAPTGIVAALLLRVPPLLERLTQRR